MQLPSRTQLRKNYKEWKEYSNSLSSILANYEDCQLLTEKLGEEWGLKDHPRAWKHIIVWMHNFDYESQWKYWRSEMQFYIYIKKKQYSFSVRHNATGGGCDMDIDKNFFSPRNKEAREDLLGKVIHSLERIYGVECRDGSDHTWDMIKNA